MQYNPPKGKQNVDLRKARKSLNNHPARPVEIKGQRTPIREQTMNVIKRTFAAAVIAVSTLIGVSTGHGSDRAQNDSHVSSRKMARTHSSSARASKKERNKNKRRAVIDRERARDATEMEEENMLPPPPVDLPSHENNSENDVESDENGSASLMGNAPGDDGGS